RGNASTDAPRSALDGTRSVPGCIPTQSVGTINKSRIQLLMLRAVKASNHANKIKRVNRHAHEPEG
ncbi:MULTISPECIES: hypothetical protein, partial [unclassified Pseudomonas]|uniref:hypothetical protein n=1 Tax=unclassified Pseudomonas TaxID=196821 RepID=UPI001C4726DA